MISNIDRNKLYNSLKLAIEFLKNKKKDETILFVGLNWNFITAKLSNIYFIKDKWKSGFLTNWVTTRKQIEKLINFEHEVFTDVKQSSKKDRFLKKKEIEKLNIRFGGIKNMVSLPDIVIFTNELEYVNGIKECNILGIPTICLIDENKTANLISFPIPVDFNLKAMTNNILKYLLKYSLI